LALIVIIEVSKLDHFEELLLANWRWAEKKITII